MHQLDRIAAESVIWIAALQALVVPGAALDTAASQPAVVEPEPRGEGNGT
jgi:hypothetical protein